jgi:hypothetical protein
MVGLTSLSQAVDQTFLRTYPFNPLESNPFFFILQFIFAEQIHYTTGIASQTFIFA